MMLTSRKAEPFESLKNQTIRNDGDELSKGEVHSFSRELRGGLKAFTFFISHNLQLCGNSKGAPTRSHSNIDHQFNLESSRAHCPILQDGCSQVLQMDE